MDNPLMHPSYQSLNEPLLFMGCPRLVFVTGMMLACALLLVSGNSLVGEIAGLAVGVAAWAAGAAIHALEPRFIGVAHLWIMLWRGSFDAGKRAHK